MKHFVAGFPRSGTLSIGMLFNKILKHKAAFHQPRPVISYTKQLVEYDLDNVPPQLNKKMEIKIARVNELIETRSAEKYLEACWTNMYVSYLIEKRIPDSKIIILFREIEDCSYSLWHYREFGARRSGKKAPDWEVYADEYLMGYEFLIKQIKAMEQRPVLLKFNRYISGYYNDYLLSLSDVEATPQMRKALEQHLKRKVNTKNAKRDFPLDKERVEAAKKIEVELESLCDEPKKTVPEIVVAVKKAVVKMEKNKIGVLITSHPGHNIFIKETLKYYTEIAKAYPVIFGWDGVADAFRHKLPDNIELMPLGKKCGLQAGERLQMLYGAEKLQEKGCEYMLKVAGDYAIKKTDSIHTLLDHIGNGDFLTMLAHPKAYNLGTAIFFCKTVALIKIIKYVIEGGTVTDPIRDGKIVVPKFIERLLGASIIANKYSRIVQLRPWWIEALGWRDLQKEWIHRTGKRMGAAWSEGAKDYDLTEEDINKL